MSLDVGKESSLPKVRTKKNKPNALLSSLWAPDVIQFGIALLTSFKKH